MLGPRIRAVGDVEEALVRDAASNVEGDRVRGRVDVVLRRRARVLHQPIEQADRGILLLEEPVAEQEAERERAQRANRVDEERVRAVERVDEPAVRQARPSPRLDRAADLQRELVERISHSPASIRPSRARRHSVPYVLTLLKP